MRTYITDGGENIEINIYERISIIKGESGEGKTLLISKIKNALVNGGKVEFDNMIKGINIEVPMYSVNSIYECINGLKNILIIIDEGFEGLNKLPEYLVLLKSLLVNNNYLVIIERSIISYSLSVNSILRVRYNSNTLIVDKFYNYSGSDCSYNNITTEDSGVGLNVYSKIFNSIINSSFGNRGIKNLIDVNKDMDRTIGLQYIVDGSVFGREIDSAVKGGSNMRENIIFYFPPSLEYIILKYSGLINKSNEWMLNYEDTILRTDDNFEIKEIGLKKYDIKSIERYFTFLLRYLIKKELGLSYDKANFDISKLNLDYSKLHNELLSWKDNYKENIYDGFIRAKDKGSYSKTSYDNFSESMLRG